MFGIILKETYSNGVIIKRLVDVVFDTEVEARNAIPNYISPPDYEYKFEFYKLIELKEVTK